MAEKRGAVEVSHHASTGYSFPFLDGIRGLAISGVVVCHSPFSGYPNQAIQIITALMLAGSFGLNLFFVLSGFLISLAVFRIRTWRDVLPYLVRRIGKIIPPFYLSILFFVLLWWLFGRDDAFGAALAFASTIAHFYIARYEWFNPPYWSLLVELHFYVLLPIIYLVLRQNRFAKTLTFSIFFIVPPIFRYLRPYPPHPSYQVWWSIYRMFPDSLDFFSWGILFACIFETMSRHPRISVASKVLPDLGLIILLGGCFLTAYFRLHILHFNYESNYGSFLQVEIIRYMEGVAAFFLLFITFSTESSAARIFLWKPLRYIGLVSYEWYLFHFPIIVMTTQLLGPPRHSGWLVMAKLFIPLSLSFALAAITYHFFSLPVLEWFKTRAKELTVR